MKRIFLLIIAIILTQTPTLALGNECTEAKPTCWTKHLDITDMNTTITDNEFLYWTQDAYKQAKDSYDSGEQECITIDEDHIAICGKTNNRTYCKYNTIIFPPANHVFKGKKRDNAIMYICDIAGGDSWEPVKDFKKPCTQYQKDHHCRTKITDQDKNRYCWWKNGDYKACLFEKADQSADAKQQPNNSNKDNQTNTYSQTSNDDPVDNKNNDRQQCLTAIKADLVDVITKKLEQKPNKVEITAQEMATLFKKHKEKCKDYLEKHKNDNNPIKISEAELNFSMKDVYEYFTK